MKIAINCTYYTPKGGGITEYIYNLLEKIVSQNKSYKILIYVTADSSVEIKNIVKNQAIIKEFPYTENQKIERSIFQPRYWLKEEKIEKFHLFHSPFFHAPKFKYAKTVLTVHDLRFLIYPKTYRYTRLIYLKHVVKKSIKRADFIITISNFTKSEILKYYNFDQNRIEVIYEAVNKKRFVLNFQHDKIMVKNIEIEKEKFLLSVGHLEPRKNYINLITAYEHLPDYIKSAYKLIIVGKKNHGYKEILKKIEETVGVKYLEFVSRDELSWLYANCKIHLFPSFYEGFGFPSLEAGLFGKPTVGANQSSIPEITGKGGIYFDPFSIDSIKESIISVLTDNKLYNEISLSSYNNLRRFTWSENAKQTLKIYNQVLQ